MRKELTDQLAKTLPPGIYWDTHKAAPPGFLLRVTKAALQAKPDPRSRSWCLNYRRQADGLERRPTIGAVASWPVKQARERAAEWRRIVDAGGDPLGEREEQRAAPTVADLWQRYEQEELPARAPGTRGNYKAMWRDWIAPAIGKLKVAAVTREDVEKLHRKITGANKLRQANAVKSLCSTLFNQSIVWHMREDNPTRLIKGNREEHRHRFLSGEDLDRLLGVLERHRERRPDSVDAIMLAVLTGARRGEILSLRWTDLDLNTAVWNKPAALVKQRREHRLAMSQPAVEVLQRRQAERDTPGRVVRLRQDAHVFRGGNSKTHANTLERDWYQFRAEAGLTDVRFHDLRHSVASWLIAAGMSLPVVGSVLGHSRAATTQRYAHLSDAAQRQAVDIIGSMVGDKGSAK
jgi:integrase